MGEEAQIFMFDLSIDDVRTKITVIVENELKARKCLHDYFPNCKISIFSINKLKDFNEKNAYLYIRYFARVVDEDVFQIIGNYEYWATFYNDAGLDFQAIFDAIEVKCNKSDLIFVGAAFVLSEKYFWTRNVSKGFKKIYKTSQLEEFINK